LRVGRLNSFGITHLEQQAKPFVLEARDHGAVSDRWSALQTPLIQIEFGSPVDATTKTQAAPNPSPSGS
jgi:hypothetical protein